MKLKMKMGMLAGALALAVAGQANASMVTGTTGSSDAILQIWDSANNTSYTKDLGINLSSFLSGVSGTSTALTANSGNATTPVGNQLFTADSLLTSFLSTANQAALVWNVTAVDNTGALNFGLKQLITTTAVNIKSAANSLSTVTQNTQLQTAIGNLDLTYSAANGASGASTSVTAGSSDTWIAKINQLNTSLAFNTSGTLGSTLNFWYLTPSSTSTIAKSSVAEFGNSQQVATWNLASNGDLTYSVAAVPEPGEWLLMLSGFGLIGFIATRRNKNLGGMTFA
jgi:hypothetical protein